MENGKGMVEWETLKHMWQVEGKLWVVGNMLPAIVVNVLMKLLSLNTSDNPHRR